MKITLKRLKWSNAFSYGENNYIDLDVDGITQIIGKNGHGKSSIALILEEVLFNTNSKKVKKGKILNRFSSAKSYQISLTFTADNDDYEVVTKRSSTSQTVDLYKNGEKVSAHTATATYAMLESMFYNFSTFTQIIHQRSSKSLEFLTATDTDRKKFLIDLLDQSKYAEYQQKIKKHATDISLSISNVQTKISAATKMLEKLDKEPKEFIPLKEEIPVTSILELKSLKAALEASISQIKENNAKIVKNNQYITLKNALDISKQLPEQPIKSSQDIKNEIAVFNAEITRLNSLIKGLGSLISKCSACGQPIDVSHKKDMKQKYDNDILIANENIKVLNNELSRIQEVEKTILSIKQSITEFERYHTLIDPTLPTVPYDKQDLDSKLTAASIALLELEKSASDIQQFNSKATANNTKLVVIQSQIDLLENDILEYNTELEELQNTYGIYQILIKAFSNTGLVAYKLECLVKDLEVFVNEYLANMSDGRFQLSFKISSADKLNAVVTDSGCDVDINELSNGELARVNISTLLAIRKLLQSISSTRINLLILDETIDALDNDGKDKLVEVLLNEQNLNTIVISHGFTHPLLNKLSVVKDNKISRIER